PQLPLLSYFSLNSARSIYYLFSFCPIFYVEAGSLSAEEFFLLTYTEIECLRRKLSSKLSMSEEDDRWELGECLGMWWRPDFETLIYPFLPPNIKRPKECTKLFLVRLPESCKFIVPKNLKLIAVPLCQVHENFKTYGPIIAGVPQLLSKFSYNTPDTD
ncbi:hypothetical protein AABB24_032781, partial [Solanum stoloniferum]